MKHCPSCDKSKEEVDFPRSKQNPDGLYGFCKACKSKKAKRAWGGKVGDAGKNKALLRNYGITLEARDAIIAAQGGHCALCDRTKDLCVDHCHDSKKIRGVLCRKCNLMLGHADDNPSRLAAAIIYLGK